MKKTAVREWVLSAIFAAVIAICAQITIPMGAVPFTLQTFGVGLTACLLGKKWGTVSVGIYLLLGLFVPVYAGGSMGMDKLFGPTGGFLLAFLLMAWLVGIFTSRQKISVPAFLLANLIGNIAVLFLGSIWLKYYTHMSFQAAFVAGVLPFLVSTIAKSIVASSVAVAVLKALPARLRANLS